MTTGDICKEVIECRCGRVGKYKCFPCGLLSRCFSSQGGIEALVELLRTGSPDAQTASAEALSNLSADDDNQNTMVSAPGCVEALVELMRTGNERGRTAAAGAIWNLSANSKHDNTVVERAPDCVSALVELVQTGSADGRILAAGALCNISSNTINQKAVASAGGVEALTELLQTGIVVSQTLGK